MGKDKDFRHDTQVKSTISSGSSTTTIGYRNSRQRFTDAYATEIQNAIEARRNHKIIETHGNIVEDLTPRLLEDNFIVPKLEELTRKLNAAELANGAISSRDNLLGSPTQKFTGPRIMSLENSISVNKIPYDTDEDSDSVEEDPEGSRLINTQPFIKIVLRKSKEIVIFENLSKTVLRGSIEGYQVDEDNKNYDHITTGKGRIRRVTTSEAQTVDKLYKSREMNTQMVRWNTNRSQVSNYLMYKSFREDRPSEDDVAINNDNRPGVIENKFDKIFQKNEFKIVLMKTLRILAGNVFEKQQCRFRNFGTEDHKNIEYNLNVLLRFNPQTGGRYRRPVADLVFCPANGDIIAVAYGIFSYGYMPVPEDGYCCVWNIKNPVNPERKYFFNAPAISVKFSHSTPQLLAIGLYDGTVEIRDISTIDESLVAISLHTHKGPFDPIPALEWVPQVAGAENFEIEPLLALSRDGSVIKYRIISSPYLLPFKQMQLERIEGTPEGLPKTSNWNQTKSFRYPQGVNIKRHPNQFDIYYILTNEGCIHKCSTNYPHQHLEVLQAHMGSVNDMDFSPWSPKLFLTCGSDWYIRIWLEGILKPIITLKNECGPVHCAAWSKTHSTVIVSNSLSSIHVWDLRRCALKPVNSTQIDKAVLTTFKFSLCGRSIAIGNEKGSVIILALDDMPFTPHFQYDELELAIYKCIETNPDLTTEVKSIGYFGYPKEHFLQAKKTDCTLMQ